MCVLQLNVLYFTGFTVWIFRKPTPLPILQSLHYPFSKPSPSIHYSSSSILYLIYRIHPETPYTKTHIKILSTSFKLRLGKSHHQTPSKKPNPQ